MAVLPTLSAWAASRLTSTLQSKTRPAFDTAFDQTFAAQCNFTVNGRSVSRDAYKAQLLQQSGTGFGEADAVVSIQGQTQVETGNQGQLSGLVGLFYVSVSDSEFLVFGAPTESKATSSVNFVIEATEKAPPNPLHVRGYFDPRRVVAVNQVVSESSYHATIPASSVPRTTTTTTTTPSKTELCSAPGSFTLPPTETGAVPEKLPGFGAFGVGPVIVPGETVGESTS